VRFRAVVEQQHITVASVRHKSVEDTLRRRCDSIHTSAAPGDYRLSLSRRSSHRAPCFCAQRRAEHRRRSADRLFNDGVRLPYLAVPVASAAEHPEAGVIQTVIGDQMTFIAHSDQQVRTASGIDADDEERRGNFQFTE